jgi:hypothetical protein
MTDQPTPQTEAGTTSSLKRVLDQYLDTGVVGEAEWREMCRDMFLTPQGRKGSLIGVNAAGEVKAVFTPGWIPKTARVSGIGGVKAGRVSGVPVYDPAGTTEYRPDKTHRDCGHRWDGHRAIRDGFSCDYCSCRIITRGDKGYAPGDT